MFGCCSSTESIKSQETFQRGKDEFNYLQWALRITTAVAIALFALSIVFAGLAQMDKFPLTTPLYTFLASLGTMAIAKFISLAQEALAEHYGIPIENLRAEKEDFDSWSDEDSESSSS